MKSRSKVLESFVTELDETLSKIHQKTIEGRPINPGDDEWTSSRERLMKIKIYNGNMNMFPINWQLADYLISTELGDREDAHPEHVQLAKRRN